MGFDTIEINLVSVLFRSGAWGMYFGNPFFYYKSLDNDPGFKRMTRYGQDMLQILKKY